MDTAKEVNDGGRTKSLERIVRDTLWMARRYAHGRSSYAVGMFNDAARLAEELGIHNSPDGSPYAIDGVDDVGSPGMSGLSQQEYDAAVAGLNAVGITPVPGKFSESYRASLPTEGKDR